MHAFQDTEYMPAFHVHEVRGRLRCRGVTGQRLPSGLAKHGGGRTEQMPRILWRRHFGEDVQPAVVGVAQLMVSAYTQA